MLYLALYRMKKYLQPLKFNHPENDVFFWGCLHLGHRPSWENPLWRMRGFSNGEEHDQTLEDNWKKTCKDTSLVFLLGDTCFGYEAESFLDSFLNRVPFKECYLLPGNHTAGWKQLLQKSNEEGEIELGDKKIYLVPNYLELFLNGYSIVLSHYPILSWNGMGKNQNKNQYSNFHFYSHVHNSLNKSELGKMYINNTISSEVSVEHFKSPPSFNDLKILLNQKAYKKIDHHGVNTENPF